LIATNRQSPPRPVVCPASNLALDAQSWELHSAARDCDARLCPPPSSIRICHSGSSAPLALRARQVVALGPSGAHDRERYISEALRPPPHRALQRLAAFDVPLPIERALETVA